MKLQELISQTELNMTLAHIKAFYLGAMCAEKPMPFQMALEEMLAESPEAAELLQKDLKDLWDEVKKNKPFELQNLFPVGKDTNEFLTQARDQLDFFLTSLSLAGTSSETCEDEDVAELIDELEDTVMDLDEYLSGTEDDAEEAEELKSLLLETWQDYVRSSKP